MSGLINILCFGDSNTHGTCPMNHIDDVRRFDLNQRWTGVAQSLLRDQVRIIEEGHPGRTTLYDDPLEGGQRNGQAALKIALESHRPIDILVMMLGTNDLKVRFSVNAREIALSVKMLANQALSSNCGPHNGPVPKVLLIAPPVVLERGFAREFLIGAEQKSREFAARFDEIARSLGIDFLDAGAFIQSDPLDGVHFSLEAHRILGKAIAAKLGLIAGISNCPSSEHLAQLGT